MLKTKNTIRNQKLQDFDIGLFLVIIALTLFGLALIYSAGAARNNMQFFQKQLLVAIVGFIVMVSIVTAPPRLFYAIAYPFYALSIIALMIVLIAGVVGFGAKRWLAIGGLQLQPSEPAKIAFILMLASIFSDWRSKSNLKLLWLLFAVGIPVFGLVLVQPDLGTSSVFPIIAIGMLAWYGLPLSYFLIMGLPFVSVFISPYPYIILPVLLMGLYYIKRKGLGWLALLALTAVCVLAAITAPMVWDQLEPYQKNRLITFMNPSADPLGSGYQVIQSQVAIGSGGLTGMGYMEGTQTQLRFLPQQHTDFIFSLAGEEFGLVGTTLILFLYFIFGYRSFRIASIAKNQFMGFTVIGLSVMILYHCLVNIGMALSILPVTGLPLPFLSYGGSFLLSCLVSSGIILSASFHRREY